jgi:hypothetical protein
MKGAPAAAPSAAKAAASPISSPSGPKVRSAAISDHGTPPGVPSVSSTSSL